MLTKWTAFVAYSTACTGMYGHSTFALCSVLTFLSSPKDEKFVVLPMFPSFLFSFPRADKKLLEV
jgi:hypothetical protein